MMKAPHPLSAFAALLNDPSFAHLVPSSLEAVLSNSMITSEHVSTGHVEPLTAASISETDEHNIGRVNPTTTDIGFSADSLLCTHL